LVLDKAQHFRKRDAEHTQRNVKAFLSGPLSPFQGAFALEKTSGHHNLDDNEWQNPQLQALFKREVKRHPEYGQRRLEAGDLRAIVKSTCEKYEAQKIAAFREQHPGLAQYAAHNHAGTPPEQTSQFFKGLVVSLLPVTAQGHPLSTEPKPFRETALNALD